MSNSQDFLSGSERVLIIQLSAIGDVLRAGSVVSTLRRIHPKVEIGMVVFSDYREVLAGIAGLSRRHVFPNLDLKRGLQESRTEGEAVKAVYESAYLPMEEIQRSEYELAVNFHFSPVSVYVSVLSAARRVLGMAMHPTGHRDVFGAEARLLHQDLSSPDRRRRSTEHLAIRYHRMLALPTDDVHLSFTLDAAAALPDESWQERLPGPRPHVDAPTGRRVAVHVGAGWLDKCWPADRWLDLMWRMHRERQCTPVLLGTIIERDRNWGGILRRMEFPWVDGCGLSFQESAALLRGCDLFVGADSGPMHLASALGVPSVALFGPTCSAESYPLDGRNAVIQRDRLDEISVDEVWEAVEVVSRFKPIPLPRWRDVSTRAGMMLYENPPGGVLPHLNVA